MKTLRFAALICAALFCAGLAYAETREPFSIETRYASATDYHSKWARAQRQIDLEQEEIDRCRYHSYECTSHAQRFLDLVALAGRYSGRVRLAMVNREINLSIIGTEDVQQYGVRDYWAGPLETLRSSRGDCEVYAILKYAVLRASGVPEEHMRLVVVAARGIPGQHAVLLVLESGEWRILDNVRTSLIRDEDALGWYMPIVVLKRESKTAEK
jgi:predicted transglutaminase-like cysteine proteinase